MNRVHALVLIVVAFAASVCRGAAADGPGAPSSNPFLVTQPATQHPAAPFVDLDEHLSREPQYGPTSNGQLWTWQVLPTGLLYSNYLAGPKESRLSANWINVRGDGWLFDTTLGSRVGVLRYGTEGGILPDGFQVDVEGSAQLRLDIPQDIDVRSVDFRAGVPLSFASGPTRWKIGYYHLSSHVGDEFLIRNPAFPRLNYVRDTLVLGHSLYATPQFRIYAEAGWAFHTDVADPFEFQFGMDYAPPGATGIHGAPFAAVNAHLREDVDFGGSITAQAGWAWRSEAGSPLLRLGGHYFNGKSNQYSFFTEHEQQFGVGVWYDF